MAEETVDEDLNHDSNNSKAVHEADLTKGMEHMRFYVSVPTSHNPKPHSLAARNTSNYDVDERSDKDVYGVPESVINPSRQPPTRSKVTESNPQKRADPFQFGSRYLEDGDDIFEFNAWDHVEVDDAFKAFAEEQFARQKENPASDYHRSMLQLCIEKR